MTVVKEFLCLVCFFIKCLDCQWSVGKSQFTNNPTTKYAVEHSTGLPQLLQEVLQASNQLPGGGMTSATENMQLAMNLIRATNAKRALDVGTFGGVSAIAMALAMPSDGIVVTMDITDQYWNTVGQRFVDVSVNSKIDKRLTTPASDTMNTLIQQGSQGQYDFCYIDADKTNYDTYYEQCLTLLRPLGMILFDNVLWGGSVLNPNKAGDTIVIDRLNTKLASDNRVWANLITIGDGVMLVVKRP